MSKVTILLCLASPFQHKAFEIHPYFYVSVVYSIVWLSRISLYEYIIIFHESDDGHMAYSIIFITNKPGKKMYMKSYIHMHFHFSWVLPRAEIAGS